MCGVETRTLNQTAKRNAIRFEGDVFMFRLTKDEAEYIRSRSQIVTLNDIGNHDDSEVALRLRSQFATLNKGRGANIKYLPFAFTELGVVMLSSVLKSETAIYVNRGIMRACVEFRHLAASLPAPNTNAEIAQ